METYSGLIVFRYYQNVMVEAESEEEARNLMHESFSLAKTYGESEIYDFTVLKKEKITWKHIQG